VGGAQTAKTLNLKIAQIAAKEESTQLTSYAMFGSRTELLTGFKPNNTYCLLALPQHKFQRYSADNETSSGT